MESFRSSNIPAGCPVGIIFDTDIGNDIDDALALAALHALQGRGEANILAVTITKEDPWTVPYVSLLNTFYGSPSIPIGLIRDAAVPANPTVNLIQSKAGGYLREVSERRRPDGGLVYRRPVASAPAPDAVALLRSVLAGQPDASVVMVQVGASTNFARLIKSKADQSSMLDGVELVRRKVRFLSVMAGSFPEGQGEWNIQLDVASAQTVFGEWPTPIFVSGVELASSMPFPAASIERDFAYMEDHPVAEGYRAFTFTDPDGSYGFIMEWPYDASAFDVTSVLYAVRPGQGYFTLSKPGRIIIGADASSVFAEADDGNHYYLVMDETQKQRVQEAIVLLASQPPVRR